MSFGADVRLQLVVLCAVALSTVACDEIRRISPDLTGVVIAPGRPEQTQSSSVIPTRAPPRRFIIEVEDERSLTYLAHQLGVPVEELINTNKLRSTAIAKGLQLHVDAAPADVARYLAKRQARKARRAAKARKRAAEKAAKKKARRAAVSKRRAKSKRAKRTRRALKASRRKPRKRRATRRPRRALTK